MFGERKDEGIRVPNERTKTPPRFEEPYIWETPEGTSWPDIIKNAIRMATEMGRPVSFNFEGDSITLLVDSSSDANEVWRRHAQVSEGLKAFETEHKVRVRELIITKSPEMDRLNARARHDEEMQAWRQANGFSGEERRR